MFEALVIYVICLLVMLLSSSTSLWIWEVLFSLMCGICLLFYLLFYILICMWWFYSGGTSTSSSKQTNGHQRSSQQHTYQIPASALYESADNPRASGFSIQTSSVGSSGNCYIVVSMFIVLTVCLFDLHLSVNLIKFKVFEANHNFFPLYFIDS